MNITLSIDRGSRGVHDESGVVVALNAMSQLTNLELRTSVGFSRYDHDESWTHECSVWLQEIHWPKLKMLRFFEWKITSVVLNKFLFAHKDTIEQLEICQISILQKREPDDSKPHRCWFTPLGRWSDVFETLLQFPRLEKLWLANFDRVGCKGQLNLHGQSRCIHAERSDKIIQVLRAAQAQADLSQDLAELREDELMARDINGAANWGRFTYGGKPWAHRRRGDKPGDQISCSLALRHRKALRLGLDIDDTCSKRRLRDIHGPGVYRGDGKVDEAESKASEVKYLL